MNPDKAFQKTILAIKQSSYILLAVMLLIAAAITLIPVSFYSLFFSNNVALDSLMGAALGSVAAGNPLNSYIIGGELLEKGISIVAVTAFLLSWVTVGVVQFPAEAILLGKRFALVRNVLSFISAILIAVLVAIIMSLI